MRLRFSSMRRRTCVVAAVGAVLAATPAFAQLRAFGDAEGYGAAATGGRGGTIYHVTNLNDTGAGSFRDAVSASNRIVVFDVGGEIKLNSGISSQGNITIAGQTAPGEGITLTGFQAIGFTQRSNIIMRYVRMRPGDSSPGSDNGMSMTRTGTAILDHVSIEFGKYNNIDAVADTADAPRITIQHSIIADPISNDTSTRGQGFGAHLEAVNGYYTISNNLWANSHSRNPLAKVNEQFKNNIEYNNEIGYLTSGTTTAFKHDLVNNAFIFGPASTSSGDFGQLSTPDKFYAVGNVQDTNKDGAWNPTATAPTSVNPLSSTPYHGTTDALPTLGVDDAYAYVLAHAGSSLSRDALDNVVIGQVQTLGNGPAGYTAGTAGPAVTPVPLDVESPFAGHYGLYHKASDTGLSNGGLGTTATSSRAAGFDADNDGVADAWEASHGMSSALASDALKTNALGYLMIEQYINELGDQNATAAWTDAASAPGPYVHATVRGTGVANGALTITTTPAIAAAPQAMTLSIGGNGPAAGETVTVSSGGRLNVYDTITVGDFNNGALNISGGTVSTWNVQLGHTDFSGASPVSYAGTLNLSSGTLEVSQIALGAGTVGNWNSGGSVNLTGGTIRAVGALSINAPIAVGGTSATINTNSFDGTISGSLSGTGTLTKSGAGTLTLSGANSGYTGAIKLNTGAITLATNSANSSKGAITAANGTQVNVTVSGASTPLTLGSGATVTIVAGGITYGGVVTGLAGTTLAVSTTASGGSNFSFGGDVSAFAGTMDLGASTGNVRLNQGGSALANFNLGTATGVLRPAFDGTTNLGSLAGGASTTLQGSTNGTVSTTFVVGANGASTTFAGVIADGTNATPSVTSFTKTGAGTLTLSNAANTYSGVTTISGGTLAVAALANGGAASSIGKSAAAANNLVLDGGTLRLNASGTTDRSLTVTAAGGTISTAANATFTTSGDVVSSGTGDRTFVFNDDGLGTSSSNLNGAVADPTGGGKLSFYKDGSARLFFNTVAKTYSGDTTINNGSLYLGGTDFLPHGTGKGNVAINAAGKLVLFNNNTTINGLSGSGTLDQGGTNTRTLTIGDGNGGGSFAGAISGSGLNLNKIGTATQTLSGPNLWGKGTTVSGGKLILGSSLIGGTGVTVQSGATLELAAGSGAIVKAPSVTVTGSGRLDVKDNALIVSSPAGSFAGGAYTGVTGLVAAGRGDGSWNGGGVVTTSAAANDYTTLGVAAASDALGIAATETATWRGQTVAGSDTLVMFTYGGDANLDGVINIDDYTQIDSSVAVGGALKGWFNGDFNYDGDINIDDYTIIDSNLSVQGAPLGAAAPLSSPMTTAAVTAVPEPASIAAVFGCVGLFARRRRHRSL